MFVCVCVCEAWLAGRACIQFWIIATHIFLVCGQFSSRIDGHILTEKPAGFKLPPNSDSLLKNSCQSTDDGTKEQIADLLMDFCCIVNRLCI